MHTFTHVPTLTSSSFHYICLRSKLARYLGKNADLARLPQSIGLLGRLEEIDVSECCLLELPSSIGQAMELQRIDASGACCQLVSSRAVVLVSGVLEQACYREQLVSFLQECHVGVSALHKKITPYPRLVF